ncbi:MAG: hypothetical protein Kow0019_04290 [Methanobacteriaceae archaeon]
MKGLLLTVPNFSNSKIINANKRTKSNTTYMIEIIKLNTSDELLARLGEIKNIQKIKPEDKIIIEISRTVLNCLI